jgi:hypothetical protein
MVNRRLKYVIRKFSSPTKLTLLHKSDRKTDAEALLDAYEHKPAVQGSAGMSY